MECIGCGKTFGERKKAIMMCMHCLVGDLMEVDFPQETWVLEEFQLIREALVSDVENAAKNDPAAKNIIELFTSYPGLQAVTIHRVAHLLWKLKFPFIPRYLSSLAREHAGIDIHPGAKIGKGFFIDHGGSVVIGETTEIGDYVTLYQGVTLGGVSLDEEKRHPTLGNHITVGAGAKILGPVTIGDNVMIGANSVVVSDIPPDSVVVGIPGKVISRKKTQEQEKLFDHNKIPDLVWEYIQDLNGRIEQLENQLNTSSRNQNSKGIVENHSVSGS